ncbi:uncharacterized protein MELLADRAFT_66188 [Melampsora larici-populina 98AG31]|uniref:Uncharacterized protein n=1 Tax=Melampsora larici-populina (strain 98AG31 / pathotype 3-4-7) TaxID=747676 RepID=F4RY70_MELLP|nr:uncharacterized protein MELLADRAFT_66188 [Melampsora larici-populina 98AG31]EGG02690.1 hypothetical protein MELLADRAFT_66188 [Melampsora larici-populina 98AG31]
MTSTDNAYNLQILPASGGLPPEPNDLIYVGSSNSFQHHVQAGNKFKRKLDQTSLDNDLSGRSFHENGQSSNSVRTSGEISPHGDFGKFAEVSPWNAETLEVNLGLIEPHCPPSDLQGDPRVVGSIPNYTSVLDEEALQAELEFFRDDWSLGGSLYEGNVKDFGVLGDSYNCNHRPHWINPDPDPKEYPQYKLHNHIYPGFSQTYASEQHKLPLHQKSIVENRLVPPEPSLLLGYKQESTPLQIHPHRSEKSLRQSDHYIVNKSEGIELNGIHDIQLEGQQDKSRSKLIYSSSGEIQSSCLSNQNSDLTESFNQLLPLEHCALGVNQNQYPPPNSLSHKSIEESQDNFIRMPHHISSLTYSSKSASSRTPTPSSIWNMAMPSDSSDNEASSCSSNNLLQNNHLYQKKLQSEILNKDKLPSSNTNQFDCREKIEIRFPSHIPISSSTMQDEQTYPKDQTPVFQMAPEHGEFEDRSSISKSSIFRLGNHDQHKSFIPPQPYSPEHTQIDERGVKSEPNMHLHEYHKAIEIQDPPRNFPFCHDKRLSLNKNEEGSTWWLKAEKDLEIQKLMNGNMKSSLNLFGPEGSFTSKKVLHLYLDLWRAVGLTAEDLKIPEHTCRALQTQSFEYLTALLHLRGFHRASNPKTYQEINGKESVNQYVKLYKTITLTTGYMFNRNNIVFDIMFAFFKHRAEDLYERMIFQRARIQALVFKKMSEEKRRPVF